MSDVRLPQERKLIAFRFPDQPPASRYYWFLVERGEIEMGYSDPGGPFDLRVNAESMAFIEWHYGTLEWSRAVSDGRITVRGDRELAAALPTWNTHVPAMVLES
ncbi:MAG TPA: hypothetical protein VMS99_15015 [Acidimicrobiia bacterium]|nr:hypothetical protein [Acidimicrobiia bacterium]